MKVGQVMRIEDPNLLTALSKAQAVQQYQVQTQAWEGYLASVGGKVPRQAIIAGEQTQAPASPSVTSGELTLATPQSDKQTAGTGGSAGTAGSADAEECRIVSSLVRFGIRTQADGKPGYYQR